MSRNTSSPDNRFPPDLVFLVAEKLEQVFNDIGPNTALATGEITPAVLSARKGRLHTASIVVADAESKLKSHRDNRDDEANDTYEAIVRLHDIAKGVYGAKSISYKRVKAVYDDLRKRRSRSKGSGNNPTNPGTAGANDASTPTA